MIAWNIFCWLLNVCSHITIEHLDHQVMIISWGMNVSTKILSFYRIILLNSIRNKNININIFGIKILRVEANKFGFCRIFTNFIQTLRHESEFLYDHFVIHKTESELSKIRFVIRESEYSFRKIRQFGRIRIIRHTPILGNNDPIVN